MIHILEKEIPDFDENGNLPIGIHDASIDSVIRRFGGSRSLKRSQLAKNLNAFFNFIKYYAIEVYVDGSFTTEKLSPGDVDILVVFPADFFTSNIPVYFRYLEFMIKYDTYKLHIFGYREGIDDAKITSYLNLFRTDKYLKVPKGIIRLEIK